MIVKDWPLRTLTPTAIGLDLHWPTRSAGEAMGGDEQIASALSARWEMSLSFEMGHEVRGRAYRAVKASLKGRYVAVRFPIFDPFRVRFADAGWPSSSVPFSDGAPFSDDSLFAAPDITTTVAAAGALRDEEITIEVDSLNDALGLGHFLSLPDTSLEIQQRDWLYIVTGVGDRIGDNRTFTIAPPLRAAIAVDDEVKVGRPCSLFRLKDDMSGAVSLQLGRFGQPSMDFVEVMRRDAT